MHIHNNRWQWRCSCQTVQGVLAIDIYGFSYMRRGFTHRACDWPTERCHFQKCDEQHNATYSGETASLAPC